MPVSYIKNNYMKTEENLFISFILVDTNVNSFYNATLDFRGTAKCKQKVYNHRDAYSSRIVIFFIISFVRI